MPAHSIVAIALPAWVDPAVIFAGGPALHPHAFWLDAGADARTGHSYLGLGEPADVAAVLATVLEPAAGTPSGDVSRPAGIGAFVGGYVGWFGYEWGAAHAGLGGNDARAREADAHQPGPHTVPGTAWLRVTEFVSFDHAAQTVWAVAPADRASAWAEQVNEWVQAGVAAASTARTVSPVRTATPSHTAEQHAALVERCHEVIRAGDAYQLCLTTQFSVPAGSTPFAPEHVLAELRATSPSHHAGYIRAADTVLISASPEQFLAVRGGRVHSKPIKGTRPRGHDRVSDDELAAALRASTKEQAENVMIVDLMRNDLHRVCEPGSVQVDALLAVESYAQVHQLVSTVSGQLVPGSRLSALLAATFPAGSMTGAPKRSAMVHLRELERTERGIYAGCWGYVGFDGTVDLAMVIRTIVMAGDLAVVGSGGGITSGSIVAEEVHEVGVKVRAPLAALGAPVPDGW